MTIRPILGAIAVAGALAGCSFQGALDAMVEPERQAEIIRTAQTLCRAPQTLQLEFDPQAFAQSQPLFAQLPRRCPTAADTNWQLSTYNFNTSATLGGRSERREFALVVAGNADGPWSEIQLNFQQIDGAETLIIGWNVVRTTTRPASLAFIDSYDHIRWWALGGVLLSLAALVTALLWFRRRRRVQGKGWNDA